MRNNSVIILLISIILLAMASCDKDTTPNFGEDNFAESKSYLNVEYGKDILQKMDIYLPADRSTQSTEIILLIHGGGWFRGNKEEMNEFAEEIQKQMGNKYAVANINYRLVNPLGPRYMLPTQIDDIGNAINFLERNAPDLGVRPRFVPMGVSAGGHLAMLYSYKNDKDNKIKAVVNIVGPSDLTDSFYLDDTLFSFAMKYIAKPSDIATGYSSTQFASPITWISKSSQPTISFYGGLDHLIPDSQQIKLEEELNKHGVDNEKIVYGMGHLFYEKIDGAVEDVVSRAKKFIDKY